MRARGTLASFKRFLTKASVFRAASKEFQRAAPFLFSTTILSFERIAAPHVGPRKDKSVFFLFSEIAAHEDGKCEDLAFPRVNGYVL